MNDLVASYPFHKRAKIALYIAASLCILLVVTIPLAAWLFYRVGAARVYVTRTGVKAEGLIFSDVFEFGEVERIGLLQIPLAARGLGAMIADMKLKNMGYGLNLVVKKTGGKEVKFITNQYEHHEELIEKIKQAVGKPVETCEMGLLSVKWPAQA